MENKANLGSVYKLKEVSNEHCLTTKTRPPLSVFITRETTNGAEISVRPKTIADKFVINQRAIERKTGGLIPKNHRTNTCLKERIAIEVAVEMDKAKQ